MSSRVAPEARGRSRGRAAPVDHDLPGGLAVRVVGAAPADVAAVARQIGRPSERSLDRHPDIRVSFVPHLPTPGWRSLDARRSGFNEDGYYLVAGGAASGKARIPFDRLGSPCEIVCESGVGSVPLLVDAVKLAALRKGLLPLHASAFVDRGTGVLVTGWPHTGKTAALLAFTQRGATFVADDLVFLSEDGRRMDGLRAPIGIADWQLWQLPHLWRHIGPARRLASRGVAGFDRLERALAGSGSGHLLPRRLFRAAVPALRRRLRVELPHDVVCPGPAPDGVEPRTLVFMVAHEAAEIRVEPADPSELVHRMIQLARHDGLPLLGHYLAYRFAFPDRRNRFLERVHELEAERLRVALSRLDCWIVHHPRPVSLRRLHEAISPIRRTEAAARERGSK